LLTIRASISHNLLERSRPINTRVIFTLLTAVFLLAASDAFARETIHQFNVADLLSKPGNANQLEGVSFYFGETPHPAIGTAFGEYRTNKKTNAFNKSDEDACERAMMSAMLQLHSRARSLGANAVINVESNYKNNVTSSKTEYTCGAGNVTAGVALIGTFIKTK